MHQTWDKLLFLHWRVPEEQVRPLIPNRLQIDTYEGAAWIGVTPFTIRALRPDALPALPVLSATHELNVRTYVFLGETPGVWFLSLDASNPLAVLGARIGFALPYFQARMSLEEKTDTICFASRRMHPGAPDAAFRGKWRLQESLPEAMPGSLEFFLIERYCLYAERGGRLARVGIHHRPWPLRQAEMETLSSSMMESHGLSTPADQPLLHALAAPLKVEVWRPERV